MPGAKKFTHLWYHWFGICQTKPKSNDCRELQKVEHTPSHGCVDTHIDQVQVVNKDQSSPKIEDLLVVSEKKVGKAEKAKHSQRSNSLGLELTCTIWQQLFLYLIFVWSSMTLIKRTTWSNNSPGYLWGGSLSKWFSNTEGYLLW